MTANNIYYKKLGQYNNIITYDDLLSFNNIFLQKKPFVIDLGCGSGKFILKQALQEPFYNYIGIETRYKRLFKASKKIHSALIDNICLLQRKVTLLSEFFECNSIEQVFINFPDPWPKKKQQKHRLFQKNFIYDLFKVLRNSGFIALKTDHQEYFFSVKKLLEKIILFNIVEYSEDLQNSDYKKNNIESEFEQLFLGKQKPIYYLKLVKNHNKNE